MTKTPLIIFWIVTFIFVDQLIKVIINLFFMDCNIEIIPSILEFKPVFNQKHSYVNVLLNEKLNINIGLFLHLIIFLFVATIITAVFDFYRSIMNSKMLHFAFILFISGWSCALIGNLIWKNGILDYMYLKPLSVIFDLKDLYIDLFILLFFIALNKNKSKVKSVKTTDIIEHIKTRLRNKNS